MLRLLAKRLFSTEKLIKVHLKIEEELETVVLPQGKKLASCLRDLGVPLEFQCGFACSCGTCIIKLQPEAYEKLLKQQPIYDPQNGIISSLNLARGYRLSCQLKVSPALEGATLDIELQ